MKTKNILLGIGILIVAVIVVVFVEPTNKVSTESPLTNSKIYNSPRVHFSYSASASIISDANDQVEIGIISDDLERVKFYSSHVESFNGNYIASGPQTFGRNIFETYLSDESGTKLFVLRKGMAAITIDVPFRKEGNNTPVYIDLSSVSF